MKSYRITSVVIAALTASAAFADLPKDLKDLSPQERRQILLERRKANAKPTGGLLERPSALPSKIISVDNSQKALDDAVISPLVAAARRTTRLPLELNGTNRVAITIEISNCEKLLRPRNFPGGEEGHRQRREAFRRRSLRRAPVLAHREGNRPRRTHGPRFGIFAYCVLRNARLLAC